MGELPILERLDLGLCEVVSLYLGLLFIDAVLGNESVLGDDRELIV